jgi:hypothetical protein
MLGGGRHARISDLRWLPQASIQPGSMLCQRHRRLREQADALPEGIGGA